MIVDSAHIAVSMSAIFAIRSELALTQGFTATTYSCPDPLLSSNCFSPLLVIKTILIKE